MGSKLRHTISQLAKNKLIEAKVLDVIGDRISVRLSDNGKALYGIPFIGALPVIGDTVFVNYASGQPVAECRGKPAETPKQKVQAPKPVKPDIPQYQNSREPDPETPLPMLAFKSPYAPDLGGAHQNRLIASDTANKGAGWTTHEITADVMNDMDEHSPFVVHGDHVFYCYEHDDWGYCAVKQHLLSGEKTVIKYSLPYVAELHHHVPYAMVVLDEDTIIVIDNVHDYSKATETAHWEYQLHVKKMKFSTGDIETIYTATSLNPKNSYTDGFYYYGLWPDGAVSLVPYMGINYLVLAHVHLVEIAPKRVLDSIHFSIINLDDGILAAEPVINLPRSGDSLGLMTEMAACPAIHHSESKTTFSINLDWNASTFSGIRIFTVDVEDMTAVQATQAVTAHKNLVEFMVYDRESDTLYWRAMANLDDYGIASMKGSDPTTIESVTVFNTPVVQSLQGMNNAYWLIADTTLKVKRLSDGAIVFDTGLSATNYWDHYYFCPTLDANDGRLWYYDGDDNKIKGRWPGLSNIDIPLGSSTTNPLFDTDEYTLDLHGWSFVLTERHLAAWAIIPKNIPASLDEPQKIEYWDTIAEKPEAFPPANHTHFEADIADLRHNAVQIQGTDVTITNLSNGQVLTYNGAAWVNNTPTGGTPRLDEITDPNTSKTFDLSAGDLTFHSSNIDISISSTHQTNLAPATANTLVLLNLKHLNPNTAAMLQLANDADTPILVGVNGSASGYANYGNPGAAFIYAAAPSSEFNLISRSGPLQLITNSQDIRLSVDNNLSAAIVVGSNGKVGIGTSGTSYRLAVLENNTSAVRITVRTTQESTAYCGYASLENNYDASQTSYLLGYGANMQSYINAGHTNSGYMRGFNTNVYLYEDGTETEMTAFRAAVGTVVDSAGTITNAFGVYIQPTKTAASTISNFYGLFIATPSGSNWSGTYGLMVQGASMINRINGKLRVGAYTDPVSTLDVNGTFQVSGEVGLGTAPVAARALAIGTSGNIEVQFMGSGAANIYHSNSGSTLWINTNAGAINIGPAHGSAAFSVTAAGNTITEGDAYMLGRTWTGTASGNLTSTRYANLFTAPLNSVYLVTAYTKTSFSGVYYHKTWIVSYIGSATGQYYTLAVTQNDAGLGGHFELVILSSGLVRISTQTTISTYPSVNYNVSWLRLF